MTRRLLRAVHLVWPHDAPLIRLTVGPGLEGKVQYTCRCGKDMVKIARRRATPTGE